MHITYLVHGFPPFENAGTEQHTALLAREMVALGHQITVISATRRPGSPHGTVLTESHPSLTIHRIVNNIPALALRKRERRPEIEQILAKLIPSNTDIVHIQHTQFLSSNIPTQAPLFWTLHDAWGWCPAGGTLFRDGKHDCFEPTPNNCVQCYAKWKPQLSTNGTRLLKVAEKVSPWISANRLHTLWQKLPHNFRKQISTESIPTDVEPTDSLHYRNQAFRDLAERCHTIISPSRYLASLAQKQGWQNLTCIPHGLMKTDSLNKHQGGQGLVFIGSMVSHKGPQIVEAAYELAFPNRNVSIRFIGDGPVKVSLPHTGSISNQEVLEILASADGLVMGSIWQENYPMILLEAKAIGCPVIAPKSGGVPEIITDGIDGILYTMGSVEELSQAMKDICTQRFSPFPPRSSREMAKDYQRLYLDAL